MLPGTASSVKGQGDALSRRGSAFFRPAIGDVMQRVIGNLASAWAVGGGVCLLLIVAVTTVNAGAFGLDKLARLVGATVSGLPGYEDFVGLAISMAALMFFPYCQLRRGHVTVDLFVARLPGALKRGLEAAVLILIALLGLFLAYWMVMGMLETRSDQTVSRVLGWPQWPFYIPGILSMALWSVVAVAQLLDRTD